MKDIKDMNLFDLVPTLISAIEDKDQEKINIYAYELTSRIWVPTIDMTFNELLESYGYKEPEQPVQMIKRREQNGVLK